MKKITVLVADDHIVVRQGFRKMLDSEADLEVVGEVADGKRAVAMSIKLRPDVILMDITMPRLNGLEATRQILKVLPTTKVLILSAHNDDVYVQNASESGASGFLFKQTSAQKLCHSIREIHKGKTCFSHAITNSDRVNRQFSAQARMRRVAKFTSREMKVLQLIVEGNANKEAAAELGIGIQTVEKHREHIMRKLGIHDIAGLTRYAINAGIIESSVRLTII